MNRPGGAPLIKNLELKVGVLLVSTVLLTTAFVLYSLYARGAFHSTQNLTLIAPDAEGVSIGMPITFSGFPIGEVKRMDLADDGKVHLEISVPTKDARWLRENSVFTLEKSLVGGAKIKAHTANLSDKPLTAGASRTLITGDAAQEIPVVIERVKDILNNIAGMTNQDSQINQSLANFTHITNRMAGEYGVLEGVLGDREKARKVVTALEKTNTFMGNLNNASLKLEGVLAKTDIRMFGPEGIMDHTDQAVVNVNHILGDVRESLKKADALLANAQTASSDLPKITGNVAAATADMTQLRTEIDESARKVNHLINEINKKWPFARDVEITTP